MIDKNKMAMELCLCPSCANAFYGIPSYRIVRKDPYQVDKDLCVYCNSRLGYNYLVGKRSNVQKSGKQQIRTLESGVENG